MLSVSRSPPSVASQRLADRAARLVGQLVEPTEQPDPHALGLQLGGLASHGRLEQAEQAGDLVVGASPVLAAERVQGQDTDAATDRVTEHAADRFDTGAMAIELGQLPLARPAAIAVHDDRDVARQVLRREEWRALDRVGRLEERRVRRRRLVSDRRCVRGAGQRCAGH